MGFLDLVTGMGVQLKDKGHGGIDWGLNRRQTLWHLVQPCLQSTCEGVIKLAPDYTVHDHS